MIWAPDPAGAVPLARRTVRDIGTRSDLLPVRVGVHTGPAVMRSCDWYGSSVNLAARLAREAEPNQALVSEATRTAAGSTLEESLGRRREVALRGIGGSVAAWRLAGDLSLRSPPARRDDHARAARARAREGTDW